MRLKLAKHEVPKVKIPGFSQDESPMSSNFEIPSLRSFSTFQESVIEQKTNPTLSFPNPFFGEGIPTFKTLCFIQEKFIIEQVRPTILQE